MILPERAAFPSLGEWLDEIKRVIEEEDDRNRKKGQPVALLAGEKLILKDADGVRWQVVVATDGTLSTVAA